MTRNKAIAAYLIGLPALGGVFGLLSYVAYRLINGNDSTFVFVMMMAVWGGFGIVVGGHGAFQTIRTEKKINELWRIFNMGEMKNEYREIESTLDLLLMVLSDSFSESESIEVQEFIGVGEYGIALETIIDIINEGSKNITNEAEFLIEKAGRIMNMDATSILG